MEYYTCKNGDRMPMMGIGTWQSDPEKLYDAIVEAVRYGYRHIDCAHIYANEDIVGRALADLFKEGVVKREDLWITSKLWNSSHKRAQAVPALGVTLKNLGVDYLDLYLVHWPVAVREGVSFPQKPEEFYTLEEVPLLETWRGMEDCFRTGRVRHVGLSNFSIRKMEALLPEAEIRPEVLQVEMNPYLQQQALFDYCGRQGMCVTAFSPLGKGDVAKRNDLNLFSDPVICSIAAAHGAPVSHVLLKWAIRKGIVVIPKSVTPVRIRENFDALKLTLTDAEMARINGLDKHNRISYGPIWTFEGSPYTQENLWDE
ncbi:MAG: aldo/keto reductase [Rikenellaceae bacterium]|jgi:alcohol dehydrogenase (NADP+)|nr:aldo/keto reductase [Rikenellaceae bacterium]